MRHTNILIIALILISGWYIQTSFVSTPKIPIEEVVPVVEIPNVEEKVVPVPKQNTGTSTPEKPEKIVAVPVKNISIPEPEQETLPPPTPPVVPQEPQPDFEKINTESRAATVNILCTVKGNEMSPISGTGVVISKDGLILTNAHVAQYFLLQNYREPNFVTCIIRTGSPAYPRYTAELVYISPEWVEANKSILKDENPQGTGEYDFAFIRIVGGLNGTTVSSLPFTTPDTRENISVGEPVLLTSYPAGFLGGQSIIQGLNIASAITTIQDVFTFTADLIDVISVGGTVVSQKGASGGAVLDRHGEVIGIISTSSSGKTTSDRELNAITLAYINRSLTQHAGLSLSEFMSGNIPLFAYNFRASQAPALTELITNAISGN